MATIKYYKSDQTPQEWAKQHNLGFVDFDDISDSCYTCMSNVPDVCPITKWFKSTERIRQMICNGYERREARAEEIDDVISWNWPIRRLNNES